MDDLQLTKRFLALNYERKVVLGAPYQSLLQDGNQRWVELRNLGKGLIYRNFPDKKIHSELPSPTRSPYKQLFRSLHLSSGDELLVMQSVHLVQDQWVEIIVGRSREGMFHLLKQLLIVQTLSFPIVLLLAGFGSFFFAGRTLSPKNNIIAQPKETRTA